MTAVLRRTPRIACASGTSCMGRSDASAMSIPTRLVAITEILSSVRICFLRLVSAAGAAGWGQFEERDRLGPRRRREREPSIGRGRSYVPVAHDRREAQPRGGSCIGDDIFARQRLAAVGNPDLKVDTRAAEEHVIALDTADDGLADQYRESHILHQER